MGKSPLSIIFSVYLRESIPSIACGAGTNLVGSTVPEDGGIILDFSLMNRVLELDKSTMTATVEPGILLRDFQEYVESEGFFTLPIRAKSSPLSAGISAPTRAE